MEYYDQTIKNNNGIITLSKPPKGIELRFENEIVISSCKDIWDEITPEDEHDNEDLDSDECSKKMNQVVLFIQFKKQLNQL